MASARTPPDPLRGDEKPYEAEVLRKIWDRLHRQNRHSMVAIVGEEGVGKSHTTLRLAEEIDPSFTAERVIFDVEELLRILYEGDHQPGQAYVLDEAGVSLGRRTWQERGQVLANQALQLIRSHNLALFFTLPRLGELDSQTEGRLQAFYEITEKVTGSHVKGKWKYLEPDRTDTTGTIYHKKPRIDRDGRTVRVDWLKFTPPSSDLVDEYNKQKAAHQKEFYEETLQELGDATEEADADISPNNIVDKIRQDGGVDQYVQEINNGAQQILDKDLIAADYEVGETKAKRVKKILLKDMDTSIM